MKGKNPSAVSPLTTSTIDGTLYTRRPDVTDAIADALAVPQTQWLAWAKKCDDTRQPSEAVVYLARSVASSDKNLFGDLVWHLYWRIEKVAKRWARGFDQASTQEIIESVQHRVYELLVEKPPSRQSEFLEVSFDLAIKRHTIKGVQKFKGAPRPLTPAERAERQGDGDDEDTLTEEPDPDAPQADELVLQLQNKEQRARVLRVAMNVVKDPRHYEAIVLHIGFDWPYTSTESEENLQDYFGKSERQIRNWIKDGLARIQKTLENTHDE